MGVGSGLYMYDVVVKRWRLLSHLLMSSCLFCNIQEETIASSCLLLATPMAASTGYSLYIGYTNVPCYLTNRRIGLHRLRVLFNFSALKLWRWGRLSRFKPWGAMLTRCMLSLCVCCLSVTLSVRHTPVLK